MNPLEGRGVVLSSLHLLLQSLLVISEIDLFLFINYYYLNTVNYTH